VKRPTALPVALSFALAFSFTAASPARCAEPQARLVARSVLPAATVRAGSPPSGAFLSASERATAAANGVRGPAAGTYLAAQPVQGFSSMVPGELGTWWALADNGYAWRPNSADFQLVFYRFDPRWNDPAGPRIDGTVVLHDPDRRIPWTIACDPKRGTPLPGFSFNAFPSAPAACGIDPSTRILTGFDLDPESFVRAPDGTFWVSEEFGPFLLHVAADGRVLEAPIEFPGVRSPSNPFPRTDARGAGARTAAARSLPTTPR
jgi:glycerophosphoryl diester phosphodiesterase